MENTRPDVMARYIRCRTCTDPNSHYLPEFPHTSHVTCATCGEVEVYGHSHCSRCAGKCAPWGDSTLCYACLKADRKAKRREEIASGIEAKAIVAARKAGRADADSIRIEDWSLQGNWGDYTGFRVVASTPETTERAARWLLAYTRAEDARKPRAPWGGLSTVGMRQAAGSVDREVRGPDGRTGQAGCYTAEYLAKCDPTGAYITCLYYYSIGD